MQVQAMDGGAAVSELIKDTADRRGLAHEAATSRFYARVSHDLRTPLNAILGFAELLQAMPGDGWQDVTARDYAALIHQAGRELLGQVDDLLAHGALLERPGGLVREELDVAALAAEVVHANRGAARGAGILVSIAVAPDLPRLFTDRQLLRHAMAALLENALAAAPRGSRVELRLARTMSGGVEVRCRDRGLPVSADEVAHETSQLRGETDVDVRAMKRVSTGIGLLQQIVDMLEGELEWSTAQGASQIAFRFPREQVPAN